MVEENYNADLKARIEVTDDIVNLLTYLIAINKLDDINYKRHKDDIYFEFILMGNHYLSNLTERLDLE